MIGMTGYLGTNKALYHKC